MGRCDSLPECAVPNDIVAEMMMTGEALCSDRPATIEGVHLKAEYMLGVLSSLAEKKAIQILRTRSW